MFTDDELFLRLPDLPVLSISRYNLPGTPTHVPLTPKIVTPLRILPDVRFEEPSIIMLR